MNSHFGDKSLGIDNYFITLGKRIPAEDFSRFPPVFSPLNSGHRTNNVYPTAKQGCLFPFNSGHSSSHPLHNTQNNMFNALNNECLTSSPPFKRKMLNISGDSDLSTSTPNDSPAVQSTCKSSIKLRYQSIRESIVIPQTLNPFLPQNAVLYHKYKPFIVFSFKTVYCNQ